MSFKNLQQVKVVVGPQVNLVKIAVWLAGRPLQQGFVQKLF
jgi:hypothetical protein